MRGGDRPAQAEWQGIPDLIEARLRLTDSRVVRLQSEMVGVQRELAELKGDVAGLKGGMEALPRVLAEMLDEREQRR